MSQYDDLREKLLRLQDLLMEDRDIGWTYLSPEAEGKSTMGIRLHPSSALYYYDWDETTRFVVSSGGLHLVRLPDAQQIGHLTSVTMFQELETRRHRAVEHVDRVLDAMQRGGE